MYFIFWFGGDFMINELSVAQSNVVGGGGLR